MTQNSVCFKKIILNFLDLIKLIHFINSRLEKIPLPYSKRGIRSLSLVFEAKLHHFLVWNGTCYPVYYIPYLLTKLLLKTRVNARLKMEGRAYKMQSLEMWFHFKWLDIFGFLIWRRNGKCSESFSKKLWVLSTPKPGGFYTGIRNRKMAGILTRLLPPFLFSLIPFSIKEGILKMVRAWKHNNK